jgi:hypothetical protein
MSAQGQTQPFGLTQEPQLLIPALVGTGETKGTTGNQSTNEPLMAGPDIKPLATKGGHTEV